MVEAVRTRLDNVCKSWYFVKINRNKNAEKKTVCLLEVYREFSNLSFWQCAERESWKISRRWLLSGMAESPRGG